MANDKSLRRHFTEEQIAQAVRAVITGRSVADVAREHRMADWRLRYYVKRAKEQAKRVDRGEPMKPAKVNVGAGTPKSIEELTKKIALMVEEYIAADVRRAALAAVEKVLAGGAVSLAVGEAPKRQLRPKQQSTRKQSSPKQSSPKQSSSVKRRRPTMDIKQLTDQLLELICDQPGLPKSAYAADLKVPKQDLDRPMSILMKHDLVRAAGERAKTRYFPADGKQKAA